MSDSRKPSLPSQVKRPRRIQFDLEPCVQSLLKDKVCETRIEAMLTVTAVAVRLFKHWTIRDDPERGLYADVGNPKILARIRKRG